ncbi:hypothetical protein [Thermoanaerobacterium sp. DL9XJH110]|uniref:hypothetical protein n=1 Tax=Thermoanaerobacterium sp. DL9XJH110 TaxID=3386643 RepID=UPI003BB4D6C8
MPKSTFFYEPQKESLNSKRGCSKPGYSKTINGEYISDEMIKTLLFDLAEEFPFFGYKKLVSLKVKVWNYYQQEKGLQAMQGNGSAFADY